MQYYTNPVKEKEKISNALLSFDETEFHIHYIGLMQDIE